MKVLVLGNSANDQPELAADSFWHAIAAREIEARTGESVEMVLRRAWPNETFPAVVARWVAEERPDVVYLTVIAFWYCYESVPVRLERRLGRAGTPLRNVGIKVSQVPWFAH